MQTWTTDGGPPRDPTARCAACGVRGTAARVSVATVPPSVYQYCAACWPTERDAFMARDQAERARYQHAWLAWSLETMRGPVAVAPPPVPPPAVGIGSRVWDDVRRFLHLVAQPSDGGPEWSAAGLAEIASGIEDQAGEYDGPMPPDILAFIVEHRPPAA